MVVHNGHRLCMSDGLLRKERSNGLARSAKARCSFRQDNTTTVLRQNSNELAAISRALSRDANANSPTGRQLRRSYNSCSIFSWLPRSGQSPAGERSCGTSASGQKAKYSQRADVFRCTSNIGHLARARVRACEGRIEPPSRCRRASRSTRVGMLRALNRHVERVFNPSRKDPHWGCRKLARDR